MLGEADIRSVLERHDLDARRSLGQNFVADPGTVRRIVALSGVGKGSDVLEVGPGVGSLTLALAESGADVLAIEKDPTLVPVLEEVLARLLEPGRRPRVARGRRSGGGLVGAARRWGLDPCRKPPLQRRGPDPDRPARAGAHGHAPVRDGADGGGGTSVCIARGPNDRGSHGQGRLVRLDEDRDDGISRGVHTQASSEFGGSGDAPAGSTDDGGRAASRVRPGRSCVPSAAKDVAVVPGRSRLHRGLFARRVWIRASDRNG